jgi:hypothetical protein
LIISGEEQEIQKLQKDLDIKFKQLTFWFTIFDLRFGINDWWLTIFDFLNA